MKTFLEIRKLKNRRAVVEILTAAGIAHTARDIKAVSRPYGYVVKYTTVAVAPEDTDRALAALKADRRTRNVGVIPL